MPTVLSRFTYADTARAADIPPHKAYEVDRLLHIAEEDVDRFDNRLLLLPWNGEFALIGALGDKAAITQTFTGHVECGVPPSLITKWDFAQPDQTNPTNTNARPQIRTPQFSDPADGVGMLFQQRCVRGPSGEFAGEADSPPAVQFTLGEAIDFAGHRTDCHHQHFLSRSSWRVSVVVHQRLHRQPAGWARILGCDHEGSMHQACDQGQTSGLAGRICVLEALLLRSAPFVDLLPFR